MNRTVLVSDGEAEIWQAAYAAAFVRLFVDQQRDVQFDRAVELASAETPIAIADLAVQRLRQWRREENPSAGLVVR